MAKDKDEEVVTVDETQTVEETPTPTEPTGFIAADPPSTPYPGEPKADTTDEDEDTAGQSAGAAGLGYGYREPTDEERMQGVRSHALGLASQGSIHEAKEPILAVLARAEAYADYMLTGNTGIVA